MIKQPVELPNDLFGIESLGRNELEEVHADRADRFFAVCDPHDRAHREYIGCYLAALHDDRHIPYRWSVLHVVSDTWDHELVHAKSPWNMGCRVEQSFRGDTHLLDVYRAHALRTCSESVATVGYWVAAAVNYKTLHAARAAHTRWFQQKGALS